MKFDKNENKKKFFKIQAINDEKDELCVPYMCSNARLFGGWGGKAVTSLIDGRTYVRPSGPSKERVVAM